MNSSKNINRPAQTAAKDLVRQLGGLPRYAQWPRSLNPTVKWIVQSVRERSSVTKANLTDRFPSLDEDDYQRIRDCLPHCFPELQIGPRGKGGFRLKDRSQRKEQKFQIDVDLTGDLSQDQCNAVERLVDMFSYEDLRKLVGTEVLNSFRALVRATQGAEPRLSKESLAAGLVIRYGFELLAQAHIRRGVAKRAGLNYLGRWHAGKAGAIQFTRDAGFPDSFAGRPSESAPVDVEWISGHLSLKPLADFQKDVKREVQELLAQNGRCIMTLPTGAGKTRTAVEFLRDDFQRSQSPRTCLWVAHTQELLEQAMESVRQVWTNSTDVPDLRMERRFGQHSKNKHADEELLSSVTSNFQFIAATPTRIIRDIRRWTSSQPHLLSQWLEHLSIVIIDEAHRAAAPQYKELMEVLSERVPVRLLGLTATPFRQEYHDLPELGTQELYRIFKRIAEPSRTLGDNARETLQQRQVLAQPIEMPIDTGLRFRIESDSAEDQLGIEAIERIDRHLSEDADQSSRRSVIFQRMLPFCRDPEARILYFGPSVADAEVIAFMLRSQGISAGFVSGQTRTQERRGIIDRFKKGALNVLCNCEVLTTGFDAPQVTHVVIARPTVSHVLFEQMVGRGLRGPKFGGTPECHVINFIDTLNLDMPRLGYRAWRATWGLEAT